MNVIVFVGPTLSANSVSEILDATILPPVQQGDVYRAVKSNPKAIGIIDGYFDGVPSVWHKEILWAMEQGIPVYGSASMGALRAAELADFGMIGVGRVFQDYLSGTILDDDEVAVIHGPAELGFKPLSEPMVSVRATVTKAREEGVLPPDTAVELVRLTKELNYRDRGWDRITGSAAGLAGIEAFLDWLPQGGVDVKADDAREMLSMMAQHLGGTAQLAGEPARVERTLAWRELCDRVDAERPLGIEGDAALVDELRLTPTHYARLRDRAALALLSREEARRAERQLERNDLVQQMSRHRFEAGLPRRSDLMSWLEDNDLTLQQYETLLADQCHTDAAIAERNHTLNVAIIDELRRDGVYSDLKDRAHRKSLVVQDQTDAVKTRDPTNRTRILMWYFETCLDRDVPDDLESYATALGLEGREELIELIEAEYLFCHFDRSQA
ncbi:TfuA-like protein [Ruegeria arenilitoris]|uniref:TfuA-like protein n=1 Tax=Ruegeria arenilitoris TaxID=1173585 RepID=UPI00147FDF7E|nr:TfuA-like protein [Ruegeria arenilitoris]